jgi:hypothetical protein
MSHAAKSYAAKNIENRKKHNRQKILPIGRK